MATCGDDLIEFIDCSSISISFNVMGIATVAYTIVRNNIIIVIVASAFLDIFFIIIIFPWLKYID